MSECCEVGLNAGSKHCWHEHRSDGRGKRVCCHCGQHQQKEPAPELGHGPHWLGAEVWRDTHRVALKEQR